MAWKFDIVFCADVRVVRGGGGRVSCHCHRGHSCCVICMICDHRAFRPLSVSRICAHHQCFAWSRLEGPQALPTTLHLVDDHHLYPKYPHLGFGLSWIWTSHPTRTLLSFLARSYWIPPPCLSALAQAIPYSLPRTRRTLYSFPSSPPERFSNGPLVEEQRCVSRVYNISSTVV